MKLFSDGWLSVYEDLSGNVFSRENSPTGINAKLLECYKNIGARKGGDLWISYEWENGVLTHQDHGDDLSKAPRNADFRVAIDTQLPKKLLKRELRLSDVLTSGAVSYNINVVKFEPVILPAAMMQLLKIPARFSLKPARSAAVSMISELGKKKLTKRGSEVNYND